MSRLFIIHFAITWALIGLIWTIQLLNYPLLKKVGQQGFAAYHESHAARIFWLAGLLMLAELGSAGMLFYLGEHSLLFAMSLGALAVVWASTLFLQVPLHQKLTHGYDAATIDRLCRTNGWRTFGWSLRGALLVAILILNHR